jgi:hypothetical protein
MNAPRSTLDAPRSLLAAKMPSVERGAWSVEER